MEENTNKKTIEDMMAENLQLTREIHRMTKSVKNYVVVQRVLSVVYLLLIVVPLIISVIYLPPLLSGVIGQYQDLLYGDQNGQPQNGLKNANPGNATQGILKMFQGN